jgi:hypothetical protein
MRAAGLPAAAGAGLKPQHVEHVLRDAPRLGFFEVHAENYMVAGGPSRTTWNASARAIRCRCTASRWASAAKSRRTARTWPASPR